MKQQHSIWEEYAHLYAQFTPTMQAELLAFVAKRVYGRVLDVGAGVGKLIPHISKNKQVTRYLGVDTEPAMLSAAGPYLAQSEVSHVDLLEGGIDSVEGCWDSLVSINVLYALDNVQQFFREAFKRVKQGGVAIISTPGHAFDMQKLANITEQELTTHPLYPSHFPRYREINEYLISSDFGPNLFSLEELIAEASTAGFDAKEALQTHYHGQNITVVLEKPRLKALAT